MKKIVFTRVFIVILSQILQFATVIHEYTMSLWHIGNTSSGEKSVSQKDVLLFSQPSPKQIQLIGW